MAVEEGVEGVLPKEGKKPTKAPFQENAPLRELTWPWLIEE